MKKKVLLIGANGRIGKGFIQEYLSNKNYQKSYELILGVHKKKGAGENFKVRKISIENLSNAQKALKGIDVVINLAANPDPKASFENLLRPNIIGAYNIFEAARINKCKRVIFASSVHAIAGYGKNHETKNFEAPLPTDIYGATKAFGESLCYTFSSKYDLSCFAIRIGAYTSDEKIRNVCFSREDYNHIISQKDMAQLLHKCIIANNGIKYGILSGISKNSKRDMDLNFSRELIGYNPTDDAFKICKEVKKPR